jgi:hypothetical protein
MPQIPINDMKLHRNDLIVATQGRGFWSFDNVTALHQIDAQTQTQEVQLFAPRDGYRTRERTDLLGPMIEYYLPTRPPGDVTIEISELNGALVNSYTGEAPPPGEPPAVDPDDPEQAMLVGRPGRLGGGRGGGRGGFGGRGGRGGFGGGGGPDVPAEVGVNRFVWDLRDSEGRERPPGRYQATLRVGGVTQTQPFNVLVDPNVAARGVTAQDLVEVFEHNARVAELVEDIGALSQRVGEAQERLEGATGAEAELKAQVDELVVAIDGEDVRYGKPGLRTHVNYLRGMTSGPDQKLGRDAAERYETLRVEVDQMEARVNAVLGVG